MKSKYSIFLIITLKIIFMSAAVYALYHNIPHEGSLMASEELTSVGLNSFYYVDYDMSLKINPQKILFLSAIVLSYYDITITRLNNFYEGLKETIRIKSLSLNDYIRKTMRFFTIPVLADITISAIVISLMICFMNVENGLTISALQNIFLMSVFYATMPFVLLFAVHRIELLLVGIFTLSIFADYFVYKLPLLSIVALYLFIIAAAYGIILVKERRA